MMDFLLTRRKMLALSLGAGATFLLAACGDDDDDASGDTGAAPTTGATAISETPAPTAMADSEASPEASAGEGTVLVGDVIDYGLEPDGWDGPFGWVEMKLNKGWYDGQEIWHIRTDTSDAEHAEHFELVYVPLLANALKAEGSFASIYCFLDGDNMMSEAGSVITTIPTQENYTSAFRVTNVRIAADADPLTSEADILAAAEAGEVELEETDIIVNYPLVVWPDGGLTVDPDLKEPLGSGPLVKEPDMAAGTVTFKLHQCFPGSRYIITDTSAVPMAPMMGVVGSGPTQMLKDAGAVAPITIFLNGIAGPGVMGFQPAIFNTSAGDPAWSPFWDHYAAEWVDPAQARVLTSQAELDAAVEADEITLYNGLPDTHPNGFVVNCPSPLLAENTYTGEA